MKRTALLVPLALLLLLALVPAAPRSASACSPVYRPGASVRIADESVLIIWDAENKTQHFIRRATFDTQAPDFGFLVPTPTQPYVKEAPNEVFATLEEWTKPEVMVRKMRRPASDSKFAAGRAMPASAPVRVLDSGRVGNLAYDILAATDAEKLTAWLNKNGYATRPALTEWLKWYTENEWVITAFKIAKDEGASRVAPRAMRLTFQTDRPFHPYREPEDLRAPGRPHLPRLMRVFFIGQERVKGNLGVDGNWTARTVWADQLRPNQGQQVLSRLGLSGEVKFTGMPWLTVFEDTASPRPGTDEVYFSATEPGVVRRPPVMHTEYVDDLSSGLGAGGIVPFQGPLSVTVAAFMFGGVVVMLGLTVLAWWLVARHGEQRA